MKYEGKEELVLKFGGYFGEYAEVFLANTHGFCKDHNKLFNEGLYKKIYTALFLENQDDSISQELKNPDFFAQAFLQALVILQADFLRFCTAPMQNPAPSENLKNISLLINACEFCINNIAEHTKACTSTHEDADKIKPTNSKTTPAAGFAIHEGFLEIIQKLICHGEQLEFLNLYKGVPIRSFSKSLKIENNTLIAELELTQILAMQEENCAYIVQNDHINTNLKANILWVNTTAKTAALNKFEVQNHMHALTRKYPRVHPDRFTKAELIHADGRSIIGKVFDISQGGMGVVSTEEIGFKSGDVLTTDLELKHGTDTLFLHLQFNLIVCISYQNAYRYCLQLDSSIKQPDAALIEGFAQTREEQTIEELNALIEQYN